MRSAASGDGPEARLSSERRRPGRPWHVLVWAMTLAGGPGRRHRGPVVTGRRRWASTHPSVGPVGTTSTIWRRWAAAKRVAVLGILSSPTPAGGRGVTPRRPFVLSNAMDAGPKAMAAGPTPWPPGQRHGRRAKAMAAGPAMDAGPTPWPPGRRHGRRANAMAAGPTPWPPGQRHGRRANAMAAGPTPWPPGQRHGRRANAMDAGPTPWTPGQRHGRRANAIGRRSRDRTPDEFRRRPEADEPGPTGPGEDGQVGQPHDLDVLGRQRRRSGVGGYLRVTFAVPFRLYMRHGRGLCRIWTVGRVSDAWRRQQG